LAVFRRPDEDGPVEPDGDGPRHPAPGLGQLDALVGSMRDAGLPVDLIRTGDQLDLPAVVDHAAYRIVQESLTNVLRHALPARARVWLRYEPDGIIVKITDDGAPRSGPGTPGSGHGITGMRERAVAVGGRLSAGLLPGRGFQVTAELPVADRRQP
jgi:signal transduction histidine kinase